MHRLSSYLSALCPPPSSSDPRLSIFRVRDSREIIYLSDKLNIVGPFTNDPASAQLQIINRSTSWIVYFVSCISTSGLEYSTRPLYLTLAPGYHIKQKGIILYSLVSSLLLTMSRLVTRSVVLRDPPARYRQDIACIESIVLEGEPDKSWASKDLVRICRGCILRHRTDLLA